MRMTIPYGIIIAKARALNAIINNRGESKNSRNAAITQITALERSTGLSLRA